MHLYIHIPFCRQRCAYCDFTTYAGLEPQVAPYVDALCTELAMLRLPATTVASSSPLRPTVYIGGGTPSVLSLEQVAQVVGAASTLLPQGHRTTAGVEVTMEANPGTLMGADTGTGTGTSVLDYFHGLRQIGVNRLSLGVQSTHNPTLRLLGRLHSAEEASHCYTQARRAGFRSINLDLMFGLPEQTVKQWSDTLDTVIAWQPDHLSLYSLVLEEHTPLAARVLRGDVALPTDDTGATMYELAQERLAAAGYTHYEVSNWARGAAHMCQHNLAYWLNLNYLGAGVAAHGHCYPERYANLPTVDAYIAAVREGRRPVANTTTLAHSDLCAETMFMGLRLAAGVSYAHFRTRCGADLDAVYGDVLHDLVQQGLMERDPQGVRLSQRGVLLGNRVFERFV